LRTADQSQDLHLAQPVSVRGLLALLLVLLAVAGASFVITKRRVVPPPRPTGTAIVAEIRNSTSVQLLGGPLKCQEVRLATGKLGIWVRGADAQLRNDSDSTQRVAIQVQVTVGASVVEGTILGGPGDPISLDVGSSEWGFLRYLPADPASQRRSALAWSGFGPLTVPKGPMTRCVVAITTASAPATS
jgi:hypothetical protein